MIPDELSFPIDAVRSRFPALAVTDDGQARIYFDAPGGTQACADAISAMAAHLSGGTANAGGAFATSKATDAMSAEAHAAMADLLGGAPEEIAFGPNMTSLTLAVSRALARDWGENDELVVTRLDHDANVAPWLLAAADRGMTVRWLDLDPENGMLRVDRLPALLGPRTRLVALGGASNALGTLNDLSAMVDIVRRHSDALVFVDAVQSVPHVPTDVRAIGCDLLACSPARLLALQDLRTASGRSVGPRRSSRRPDGVQSQAGIDQSGRRPLRNRNAFVRSPGGRAGNGRLS